MRYNNNTTNNITNNNNNNEAETATEGKDDTVDRGHPTATQ